MADLATATERAPIPHVPAKDDKMPKTRRKLLFFDRVKVLVLIGVFLFFSIAKKFSDLPGVERSDIVRDEFYAKRWLLWLAAFEVLRQIHYRVSEKSAGYHQFWVKKVWGRWDIYWGKRNPWLRYRLLRMSKAFALLGLLALWLSYAWNLPVLQAISKAPTRIWDVLFGTEQGLPFIFNILFAVAFGIVQFVAIFWFMSKGGTEELAPDEVVERFSDVKGQDRVVAKVKENIMFLEKPEEIEAKGGHVPSGILLWGPPGTGKTLIAKAVAGETGRPFVFVEPGAFNNMFFGVGILKVKGLYRKLRKIALRHGGVIVFFDEADVLGNRGMQVAGHIPAPSHDELLAGPYQCNALHYVSPTTAGFVVNDWMHERASRIAAEMPPKYESNTKQIVMGGGGGGMGTLQAILTEMSGMDKPRGIITRRLRKFLGMPSKRPPKYRILHMMATNTPDALDEALKRPGRLDRIFQVGHPSLEGRKATYEYYLNKVQHVVTPEQLERLALMSPKASGAVMKDIVNEALISAIRENRDTVEWKDLLSAKSLKTHGMPDDVHPVSLERHAVALHEASHAVAMRVLKKRETIDIATIEPRGPVGGFVAPVPLEEEGFPWRSTQEDEVITYLASLAGERHFYGGDNSAGVGGDMSGSTTIVMRSLGFAAMGKTLVSHSVINVVEGDRWKTNFGDAVEEKLQELYARAQKLIVDNERWVMALSHALERYHTITGEDIDAVLNGTTGPNVDGAWYHSDEFPVLYRNYHDLAQEAHRTQSKFEGKLPMPGMAMAIAASSEEKGPALVTVGEALTAME